MSNNIQLSHLIENGYPSIPTCSDFSPELNCLALGTNFGEIRLVGDRNVQFLININSLEKTDNCEDFYISSLHFLSSNKDLCRLCAVVNFTTLYYIDINSAYAAGSSAVESQKFEVLYKSSLLDLRQKLYGNESGSRDPNDPYHEPRVVSPTNQNRKQRSDTNPEKHEREREQLGHSTSVESPEILCIYPGDTAREIILGDSSGSLTCLNVSKSHGKTPVTSKNSSTLKSDSKSTNVTITSSTNSSHSPLHELYHELYHLNKDRYGSIKQIELIDRSVFVLTFNSLLILQRRKSSGPAILKTQINFEDYGAQFTSFAVSEILPVFYTAHIDGSLSQFSYCAFEDHSGTVTATESASANPKKVQELKIEVSFDFKFMPWEEKFTESKKSIDKVIQCQDWIAFQGGLPKSDEIDYDDMHVITFEKLTCFSANPQGSYKKTLSLPSRIVNFAFIDNSQTTSFGGLGLGYDDGLNGMNGNGKAIDSTVFLLIVCEREFLCYDVVNNKEVHPPYLQALDYSQITEVNATFFKSKSSQGEDRSNFIKSNFGEGQKLTEKQKKVADLSIKTSSMETAAWPIKGGQVVNNLEARGGLDHNGNLDGRGGVGGVDQYNEYVMVGHANGEVRVYNSNENHLNLYQTLRTSQYFAEYEPPAENRYDFISDRLPLGWGRTKKKSTHIMISFRHFVTFCFCFPKFFPRKIRGYNCGRPKCDNQF